MNETPTMGIAQMATAFGVSHRSLRFYESKGLLRPQRHGTERRYNEKDAIRLRLILKGKKLGFSLEEIRRLILEKDEPRELSTNFDVTTHLSASQIRTRLKHLESEQSRLDQAILELQGALDRLLQLT